MIMIMITIVWARVCASVLLWTEVRITSCVSHNSEESERKKALFNSVDNRLKSVKFAKMLVVDGNVLRV